MSDVSDTAERSPETVGAGPWAGGMAPGASSAAPPLSS